MEYLIPKIDPKVFKYVRTQVVENKSEQIKNETALLPIIIDCKAPPTIPQGIELWYQNIPYPRKGFPDSDILNALNIVKRDTVSWIRGFGSKYLIPCYIVFGFLPYEWKIKIIDNFLEGYLKKSDYWLSFWYYQPQYFCPFAAEIRNMIRFFLWDLGINKQYAEGVAGVFCMFMEHDDRYRLPTQDILTEAVKELLHTRKELKRLAEIYVKREHAGIQKSFLSLFNLLSFALFHPKIKRAFKKAIELTDWEKIKFDEGDRYWACTWGNYDSMGLNLEQRQAKRMEYHKGLEPTPMVKNS